MTKKLCNDPSRHEGYNVITKISIPALAVGRFFKFDSYTAHKLVYDMFAKIRDDDNKSGFYFSYEKDEFGGVKLTISSSREPIKKPLAGEVVYSGKVDKNRYATGGTFKFSIIVNAEKSVSVHGQRGKVVPVHGRENIKEWFIAVAERHGFEVKPDSLVVGKVFNDKFRKGSHTVTLNKACLSGTLKVTDQDSFREAVSSGIGRGKAFGCGLLRIED